MKEGKERALSSLPVVLPWFTFNFGRCVVHTVIGFCVSYYTCGHHVCRAFSSCSA